MNREITDADVATFEGELEDHAIREQLEAQYFATNEFGVRRMTDPTYARLFRTGLQAALDLQRSASGLAPQGSPFEAPRAPTQQERAEWERQYLAVDPKTNRRLMEDPQYAAQVNALRDRTFGVRRRDPTGRVMG